MLSYKIRTIRKLVIGVSFSDGISPKTLGLFDKVIEPSLSSISQ